MTAELLILIAKALYGKGTRRRIGDADSGVVRGSPSMPFRKGEGIPRKQITPPSGKTFEGKLPGQYVTPPKKPIFKV
jgi:hypothetical protein